MFCAVCGQGPLPPGQWCPNRWCRRPDRGFSVAFAVGVHDGSLRRTITRYKYRTQTSLAGVLASLLASFLLGQPTWFEEYDLITAVPSYRGPGARRDWDPLGLVLSHLAARLGPAWRVAGEVIAKRFETPGMAGLGWAERQRVARGPLRRSLWVPEPESVQGASVLVVDDVLTEGSTLVEVARALRGAGAADVAGLVLARPGWDPEGPPPGRRARPP